MTSDFNDCVRRFRLETAWLQSEFTKMAAKRDTRYSQLACEMAVVRLHDSWSRFCRELVIVSALGNTITLGGMPLTASPGITDRASVIPVLKKKPPRMQYEPKWGRAVECINAASRLAITNLSTVSAAIGAKNSPAEEIRHVRNFYAHRRRESARSATASGLFTSRYYPVVFELASYKRAGLTVVESWVHDLLLVAMAAVQ